MLLEHQAAMKLARKLAQKIGAEPEKFGELARKAAQAPEGLGCGLNYGPIPIGAAGKALNFMHWAVNGVRPYPEEGGGGGESRSREGGSDDPCGYGTCAMPTPEGFVCQDFTNEHEDCGSPELPFTCCSPFICNPPNPQGGGFTCEGYFNCWVSFTCITGRFDAEEDCTLFLCRPPSVFHGTCSEYLCIEPFEH